MSMNNDKPYFESKCSICKLPKSNNWTIHGLWPQGTHGSMSFCGKQKYKPWLLESRARERMKEKWPTFNLRYKDENFWRHEFDKHGTCVTRHSSIGTLTEYFMKILEIHDQHNVAEILEGAKVFPGDHEYEVRRIRQALQGHFKANVRLMCHSPKVNIEFFKFS